MKGEFFIATFVSYPRIGGRTCRHTEDSRVLKKYMIPRWQLEHPNTVFRLKWILSRFQYFSPGRYVEMQTALFHDTGKPAYKIRMVASAKAQVTKISRALKEYERSWQPSLLNSDVLKDPIYIRGQEKLKKAQKRLENRIKELEQ